MPIGSHPFWRLTTDVGGLLEKALGRLHISLFGSAWNQQDGHPDRWLKRESTISL
jgi:hypothetical protein